MKNSTFLKLMKSLAKTNPSNALFMLLNNNIEGTKQSNGKEFGIVYLDNAKAEFEKIGFTSHQFAGFLSALESKGLYKPYDSEFGLVDTNKKAILN